MSGHVPLEHEEIDAKILLFQDNIFDNKPFSFKASNSPGGYRKADLSLKLFEDVVNFVNKYMIEGGNIDKLDAPKVSFRTFQVPYRDFILRIINSLNFEHFENSISVVGKDNIFWGETEITGFPEYEHSYLIKPFNEILDTYYERTKIVDSVLLCIGKSESAWSPWTPRKSTGTDGTFIKTLLAFEMPKYLNEYKIAVYKLLK